MRRPAERLARRPAVSRPGGALVVGLLVAGVAAAPDLAPTSPAFVDVAAAAGVARAHRNRSFENPYAQVMEGYTALGASVSVGDFDGDGREDLFVTDSAKEGRNRLHRNRGGLAFEELAEAAGVAGGNDASNASADSLWLDYDGDSDLDLLVVRFGRSLLYQNRGGRFAEVGREAGLGGSHNAITAVAFDFDGDSDLDLVLGCYFGPVDLFQPATPRFFPESFDDARNGGGLAAYRNGGDGTFREVTAEVGLVQTGWTLDVGHADADLDGDQDLYVAADFGQDRVYRNDGGRFTDVTQAAIGTDTKKGMNAEWGDVDGDGFFDVFVTNITDAYMREGNYLWHNDGDLTFTDVARESGTWDSGWGWGGKLLDFDDDGWLDLYTVNGWVSAGESTYVLDIFELILTPGVDLADARRWPPMGDKSLSGYQRNALFRNEGGGLFREVGARHGVDSLRDGRGVAIADLDGDGRQDVFVANANAEPHLFHNVRPPGPHWVELRLEGAGANRQAIGARVVVSAGGRRRSAFVDGGNGFAGASSRRLHFGLGEAARVDGAEVFWPSGARQTLGGFEADRRYRLREGGSLEPVEPPSPAPTIDIDPAAGGSS